MNRRLFIILLSSLLGLLAAGAYTARIQHIRSEISHLKEKEEVLLANRHLQAGIPVQARDLSTGQRAKTELSARSIHPDELDLIAGQRIFHPVPAGEVLLWTDLADGPRLKKPSEKIPAGFRAIALPADEIHTMVHFISPGDDVDIVWTEFAAQGPKIESKLIAEKIRVLGVGQRMEEWGSPQAEEDYPMSVTLLVTQNTALSILRASLSGEIHFLARGNFSWNEKCPEQTNSGQ